MSKVPSMSKLLENFRSVQEANYNPRKNLTEQELVYDIIKEVLSLRDDVAIRLNTIDEQGMGLNLRNPTNMKTQKRNENVFVDNENLVVNGPE